MPSEDYDVEAVDAEGYAVVEENGYVVALDTRVTAELAQEGLAREVVRRLNGMRKDAGFRLEDRIVTYFEASGTLADVFERYGDYIRQETLSLRLEPSLPQNGAHQEQFSLDGERVRLAVARV